MPNRFSGGHQPHGLRIARVGNGVTDVDVVRPFYEALGFEASAPFDLGTALGDQSETPGSPLVIQILRRDGFDLELVQHGGARPPGRPPARRPMNQLGFTHLAFRVPDLDGVAGRLQEREGVIHEGTRTERTLFCSDPSGARVLLVADADADEVLLDHVGICVADLERSSRFYEAIGFDTEAPEDLGTAWSSAAELDGVPLSVRRLRKEAYPVLLLQWGAPRDPGHPVRLPLNRVGELIHFGTHGDDFEAMCELVVRSGGSVVERTRGQFPPPGIEVPGMQEPHGWVFVLDPNGVQIEIVGPHRS